MYHSKYSFIKFSHYNPCIIFIAKAGKMPYNLAYFSKENFYVSKKICSDYNSCCQHYKKVYASN